MPNLRLTAIKEILEPAAKTLWEKLQASGAKRLVRIERPAHLDKLAEEGFQEAYQANPMSYAGSLSRTGEGAGIHWAEEDIHLPYLRSGLGPNIVTEEAARNALKLNPPNVEGFVLPGKEIVQWGREEVKGVGRVPVSELTERLKRVYGRRGVGLLKKPDILEDQPFPEVLQFEPNQVVAKIKLPGGKEVYRLLGATAAVGTAGVLGTSDTAEAGWRQDILKKVFKEGVDAIPKKDLKRLFKETPASEKLYRGDTYEGIPKFEKEHSSNLWEDFYEEPGVASTNYFSGKGPSGKRSARQYTEGKEVIEAIPKPGATWRSKEAPIEQREWDYLNPEEAKAIRSGRVDFFEHRYPGHPEGGVVSQLTPGTTLQKLGNKYRIYGIGAALGLGGAIMPDEANAFPIGKIVKDMTKIALKEPSSAASNLIGKVMQGKVIKAVQKGKGDWRYLLFEDGSGLPVTKDFLESVSRAQGTKDYMAKFRAAGDAEKLEMAKKSLNRHLAKTTGLSTKRLTEAYSTKHMERLDRLGLEGLEKPNLVGVWSSGRYVKMPKEYADLLEANGLVKRNFDRSQK